MKKRILTTCTPVIISLLILISGCGRVKVDESLSAEEQWQIAKSDFEYEKYLEVVDLLTSFTLNYSGSSLIDSAQFLLAESHFALGDYILAASEYQRLIQEFPQSPLIDDAFIKIILSNYYLSPRYELDQKFTKSTLTTIQDFQDQFTQTDVQVLMRSKATTWQAIREVLTLGIWGARRPIVQESPLELTKVVYPSRNIGFGNWLLRLFTIGFYNPAEPALVTPKSEPMNGEWIVKRALDESRAKLGQKGFKTAELYYKQKKYPSAVIYLDSVLELYADTPWVIKALKVKGDSQFAMHQYHEAEDTYRKYLNYADQGDHKTIENRIEECKLRSAAETADSTKSAGN
jgi:outer membrane protein assembly factor BamD (BamD/ComL family)